MKQKIKKDIKEAMLSQNTVARDILRVLIGEIERNEQTTNGKVELPENEILRIIKKLSDNIKETSGNVDEIDVLSNYLPKTLTRNQMEEIVDGFIVDNDIEGMRGMGKIMNHFRMNFPHRYDGKELSTIIKEVLQ